jgi:hypothetical protein
MLASPEILSSVLTKLGHCFVIVQAEVSFLPEQGRQWPSVVSAPGGSNVRASRRMSAPEMPI